MTVTQTKSPSSGETMRSQTIIARCREIAACTDVTGETTRTFLSPASRTVHAMLRRHMEGAGMVVTIDAAGNLRGLLAGLTPDAPRLIIGSHLDTVPNAGAFDGILGVVLGLALIEELQGRPLPFAIEVIGFSEEEGVRFNKPFLGSMAIVGSLDATVLALEDSHGTSVGAALKSFGLDPADLSSARLTSAAFAYLEMHIEQGPLLESANLPLGIVDAIVGQSRLVATFKGKANHAGTTPMHLRHDALAAAAEWIVAVERIALQHKDLVATVGSLQALPGAGNVIAGDVAATLDLRHANDATRLAILSAILEEGRRAGAMRGVEFSARQTMDQAAVPMNPALTDLLEAAANRTGAQLMRMSSGAGHDAMIVAPHLPSCMLFLRSPGGVSHHPEESVFADDVSAAVATGIEFLYLLSKKFETQMQHPQ